MDSPYKRNKYRKKNNKSKETPENNKNTKNNKKIDLKGGFVLENNQEDNTNFITLDRKMVDNV